MLAALLGVPKQAEILIIIFLGICFLSLDFSLFEIRSNLEDVWKLELNNAKHLETALKYVISAIVLVRTFSLHAFLAFYVVMLWPAIFEEKPNLMIPWLILGIIRCLILNCITFVVGTFICHREKGLSPICLEFIAAQVIEHGPSVYAWVAVLHFYRSLAGEQYSNQSSEHSLYSQEAVSSASLDREADIESSSSLETKSKSYSLSDLNLDYMHSSRFRSLSADMPMDVLMEELRHLVSKTRIIRDTSRSFDSLKQDKSDNLELFGNLSKGDLNIIEETMKILDISERDVSKAKEEKNRLIQILKEVNVDDVSNVDKKSFLKVTSPSFYIKKGKVLKGIKTHVPKSFSFHEEAKSHETCLCYIRRKLQKDQSDLSMLESEIANIKLDDWNGGIENDANVTKVNQPDGCKANCQAESSKRNNNNNNNCSANLNCVRVVVGAWLEIYTRILDKFALKRKPSTRIGRPRTKDTAFRKL